MTDNKILTKQDFDLTQNYELFDILYSIPMDVNKNQISEWCVGGFEIEPSSSKTNLNVILFRFPISIYMTQILRIDLEKLKCQNIVSASKERLIAEKRTLIQNQFNSLLDEFK